MTVVWTCHKYLQHTFECFHWHQIIYVHNMRVRHWIFFWRVPYCTRRTCTCGSLTNFSQHTSHIVSNLSLHWRTLPPPFDLLRTWCIMCSPCTQAEGKALRARYGRSSRTSFWCAMKRPPSLQISPWCTLNYVAQPSHFLWRLRGG